MGPLNVKFQVTLITGYIKQLSLYFQNAGQLQKNASFTSLIYFFEELARKQAKLFKNTILKTVIEKTP